MTYRLSLRPNGIHRKQRALNYSVTINGLMTRRSYLIAEKPDTLAQDIAAIDYALKLCGFNEDPQKYMPRLRKRQIFKKGEKRRLVMETLNNAHRPLTSREICLAILADKNFDLSDKRRLNQTTTGILNQTTTGIYNFLKRECEAGRVGRIEGCPVRWVIRDRENITMGF